MKNPKLYLIFFISSLLFHGLLYEGRDTETGGALHHIAAAQAKEAEDSASPIVDSRMTWEEAVRKGSGSPIPPPILKRLTLLDVAYYSTDGRLHKGQIVIDRRLSEDIQRIMNIARKLRFPLYSAIPISDKRFQWDDLKSMAANNTSAFNYRKVTGGKSLSKHAYGFAIDINPLFNPYVKGETILPHGARYDRKRPGTLAPDCAIVRAFLDLGWTWGGNWKTLKDYQHFQKIPK